MSFIIVTTLVALASIVGSTLSVVTNVGCCPRKKYRRCGPRISVYRETLQIIMGESEEIKFKLIQTFKDIRIRLANESSKSLGEPGIFEVWTNGVKYVFNDTQESHFADYGDVTGIRVSPPTKSRVMLQIKHKDNNKQVTFIFAKPGSDKIELREIRDIARSVIHQSFIRYKQFKQQQAKRTAQLQEIHESVKSKILDEDKFMNNMYTMLVKEKYLSPSDFWEDHLKNALLSKEENQGISSGFLGAISQSEDKEGVTLNLSLEIINAIFKTYPAVEKKHLEMVPQEISEQEFWAKFFKSHYFHRDKDSTNAPDAKEDIFKDCIDIDDRDMHKIIDQCVEANGNRGIDNEDNFGIFSSNENNVMEGEEKNEISKNKMLIKRCNYLSERIMKSIQENKKIDLDEVDNSDKKKDEENELIKVRIANKEMLKILRKKKHFAELKNFMSSYSNLQNILFVPFGMSRHEYRLQKEQEDPSIEYEQEEYDEYWNLLNAVVEKEVKLETSISLLTTTLKVLQDNPNEPGLCDVEFSDEEKEDDLNDSNDLSDPESKRPRLDSGLKKPSMHGENRLDRNYEKMEDVINCLIDDFTRKCNHNKNKLNSIAEDQIAECHAACTELIRHFWSCFPPKSQDHLDKILKIVPALKDFDTFKIKKIGEKYGEDKVEHLRRMIGVICARLEELKNIFGHKSFTQLELEGRIIVDSENSQNVLLFNDNRNFMDEDDKSCSRMSERLFYDVMNNAETTFNGITTDSMQNGSSTSFGEHQEEEMLEEEY
uniref:BSD domain-containing protein n=1 Tax=Parastrongyloides trichosuri TaxID=131310 RepID=A0A0N4Z772_PARTI